MTENKNESIQVFRFSLAYMLIDGLFIFAAGCIFIYQFIAQKNMILSIPVIAALLVWLLFTHILTIRKSIVVTVSPETVTIKKKFRPEKQYSRSEHHIEAATAMSIFDLFVARKRLCLKITGTARTKNIMLPLFSPAEHKRLGLALTAPVSSTSYSLENDTQSLFRIPKAEIMAKQKSKLVISMLIWPAILMAVYIFLIFLDPYNSYFSNIFWVLFIVLEVITFFMYLSATNIPESIIVGNIYVQVGKCRYELKELREIKVTSPDLAKNGIRRLHLSDNNQSRVYHLGRQTGKGVFQNYSKLCKAIQAAALENKIAFEMER